MKKIFILMSLVATMLSILLPSCKNDDVFDNTIELTLSEESIVASASKSEQVIEITTSSEKLQVISDREWAEPIIEGTTLRIKIAKNTTINKRKAKILVLADGTSATVEVAQRGAVGSAVINPDALEIDQYTHTKTIDIFANDKSWTAKTDADWIKLTPKQEKSELVITCMPNEDRAERIGRIFITIASVNKEIVVRQKGVLYYILPCLDFSKDILYIQRFEEARHSRKLDRTPESSDWIYDTESKLFNRIRYFMKNAKGTAMEEAHLYCQDLATFKARLSDIKSFLIQKGFEPKVENGVPSATYFYNEKMAVAGEITIKEQFKFGAIVFRYVAKQDKPYPTFKTFPWSTELPWASSSDDVRAYEASHNGVVNKDMTKDATPQQPYDLLGFNIDDSADREIPFLRLYMVIKTIPGQESKGGLSIKSLMFKDVSLAFYKSVTGEYFMTQEFKDLVLKNGYMPMAGDQNGYISFKNDAEKIILGVKTQEMGGRVNLEILFRRETSKN